MSKPTMQKDPTKVTEKDVKILHAKLSMLVKLVNGSRKFDLNEIALEKSLHSEKPKLRGKFISKWNTTANSAYPSYDYVNYVMGDTDGTWEKLNEWYDKLLIKARRVKKMHGRLKAIIERVGDEDWIWFLQSGLPSGLIDETGELIELD